MGKQRADKLLVERGAAKLIVKEPAACPLGL